MRIHININDVYIYIEMRDLKVIYELRFLQIQIGIEKKKRQKTAKII